MPKPDEPASVMLADTASGQATKAETFAWNFQQGAMLHWNPVNPEEDTLFNQRAGDAIISVSLNTRTGKSRKFSRQIDALSKRLIVANVNTGEHAVLGDFPMLKKEFLGGDRRCDLHSARSTSPN